MQKIRQTACGSIKNIALSTLKWVDVENAAFKELKAQLVKSVTLAHRDECKVFTHILTHPLHFGQR